MSALREWQDEADAQRARADAAEADRDYWRTQATMAAPCVDAVRALGSRLIPGGTGCAVDPERVVAAAEGLRREAALATMERDTLRAIVEGRTRAPTDAEIAAHAAAGGAWLLQDASYDVERVSAQRARVAAARTRSSVTTHQRWWAIDREDRPCPWPTALDAGEGR